jgi:hypothetical protein
MEGKSWLAPLTGILFVAVAIVAFAVGGEPKEADEGAQAVADFYVDNKDSVQFGAALQTLAAALLVFFAGHLRKVIHAAEGEGHSGSLLVFGGALIMAIGIAIDGTLFFAASEAADSDNVDPQVVQTIQALWDNDFFPMALGAFVFLLSLGASIVRTGVVPKWLGWVAIALGVVAISPAGFVSFLGAAILVVIISVILIMRARSAGGPGGTSAPASPGAPPA